MDLTARQRDSLLQVLWLAVSNDEIHLPRCSCCGAVARVFMVSSASSCGGSNCCPEYAAHLRENHTVHAVVPLNLCMALWEMVDLL